MKQHYTIISIIFLFLFPCCNPHKEKKTSSNPQSQKFECELFSVSIPSGYYYAEESKGNDFHKLIIGKDSLDADKTTIMWESSNIFPGSAEQFVGVITAEEIEDYESSHSFYDVLEIDSTFVIDGFPTYSISSIFTEDGDTIIQSRTGIVCPNKFDMMIIQRANTSKSEEELQPMFGIISSIRFK